MRILFRGPLGSVSGYGRDGIGIVRSLLKLGHEVTLEPTTVQVPLPTEVADLMRFPIEGHFDLEIHHVPITDAYCLNAHKERASKVILWTMWEFDNLVLPSEEAEHRVSLIRNYDHVLVYTEQTKKALMDYGALSEDTPVTVLQGGFEPDSWMPAKATSAGRDVEDRTRPAGTFRYSMVGHLSTRKNAFTVILAFMELKRRYEEAGEVFDAELILKTGYPILPPTHPFTGVKVVAENQWTDEQLRYFYWNIDCLVNVAHGEGKDLPAMEATMCGVPTILNACEGHKGWVHPTVGKELLPVVPHTLNPDKQIGVTLEDPDSLIAAMDAVYKNKPKYIKESKDLAAVISKRNSWDAKVKRMGEIVGVSLGGR